MKPGTLSARLRWDNHDERSNLVTCNASASLLNRIFKPMIETYMIKPMIET
jgi:hypothetical protein